MEYLRYRSDQFLIGSTHVTVILSHYSNAHDSFQSKYRDNCQYLMNIWYSLKQRWGKCYVNIMFSVLDMGLLTPDDLASDESSF